MIMTAGNILSDNLANVVHDFPSFNEISPFYNELADVIVGVDKIRVSLSSVQWASKKIKEIARFNISKIYHKEDPKLTRQSAIGRMSSVVNRISKDLEFLDETRNKLRKLPDIRDEPTIGHFTRDDTRYQIVDTPGLFDRPLKERNTIERQAILALAHQCNIILFILDPSETCGYVLEEQQKLQEELVNTFSAPVVTVYNKKDLVQKNYPLSMSTLTEEGTDAILELLIEKIS